MEDLRVGYPIDAPNGRWYFRRPLGYGDRVEVPLVGGYEPFPPGYGTLCDAYEATRFRTLELNMGLRKFRNVPNDGLVAPLLISFARAISQMPLLKSTILWNNIMQEPMSFSVESRAPEYLPKYLKDNGGQVKHDLSKPRIIFEVASGDRKAHGWRPSEDIIEMFRNVSIMAHDTQAHITAWWDDEGAGEEEEEEESDSEGFSDEGDDFGHFYNDPEYILLDELAFFLDAPPNEEDVLAEIERYNQRCTER